MSGDALKRRNGKAYNPKEIKELENTIKGALDLKILNNSNDLNEFDKEAKKTMSNVRGKSKGLSR